MKFYFVGIGKDLLDPSRCDGPFDSPEDAKAFMKEFTNPSPEMLAMAIVEATVIEGNCSCHINPPCSACTDPDYDLDIYKENDQVVTLGSLQ